MTEFRTYSNGRAHPIGTAPHTAWVRPVVRCLAFAGKSGLLAALVFSAMWFMSILAIAVGAA